MHTPGVPLEGLTRRELITGLTAGAVAIALGSYGEHQSVHAADGELSITAADARKTAVRGNSMQLTPIIPAPKNWRPGQFVTEVSTEQPFYAGTLDDGPSPFNTETILRAAEKHKQILTWFVIGDMVRAFPEILHRIYDAGHQIGNHSVHHTPYTAIGLAPQVAANQEIIKREIGIYPTVARAPGLTRGQVYLDACRDAGVYEAQTAWTTNDSSAARIPATQILAEHIRGLKKGGIEINHDGGNKRPTPDAYDAMLQYSRDAGITSVSMDELMNGGIPMPASGRYPGNLYLRTSSLEAPNVDVCNFDIYTELEFIKEHVSLKRAQRSRVIEVLADIDLLSKAS